MTIFWPLTTLAEPSTPTVPGELRKPSLRTGCGPQLRGRLLDELLTNSGRRIIAEVLMLGCCWSGTEEFL